MPARLSAPAPLMWANLAVSTRTVVVDRQHEPHGTGAGGRRIADDPLLELGWVTGDLPRLVAVQAAGCAPIVRALRAGAAESEPWPDPQTVAFGLTVPEALGDFLILEALYATGGTAVTVTDDALLADQGAGPRQRA